MEFATEWFKENKVISLLCVMGLVLAMVGGVWWWKSQQPVVVEILDGPEQSSGLRSASQILVDVQGEVIRPGVYFLATDARIKDAIAAAGGMSAKADRIWVARYVNLAQKVVDGAKIFIPAESAGRPNEKQNSNLININTASQGELDDLTGIGETRAKAIIAGRPYGDINELVSKKIIPQSIFDKIKTELSIY